MERSGRDIDRKLQFQPQLFLVGTVDAWWHPLSIGPDFQGLGYGRALMAHIETVLAGLGCPKLNIVVHQFNVDVVGFAYNGLPIPRMMW